MSVLILCNRCLAKKAGAKNSKTVLTSEFVLKPLFLLLACRLR